MSDDQHSDLPKISRPAASALASAGITSLAEAAAFGRSELLRLHGVGPQALRILDEALAEHGLTWADR